MHTSIKSIAVSFRSQLQLIWVETGGGTATLGLDLFNCYEVRSAPSLDQDLAPGDIKSVAARTLDETVTLGGIEELSDDTCGGVERVEAESPGEGDKAGGSYLVRFFLSRFEFWFISLYIRP